jgi:hypothetical protein
MSWWKLKDPAVDIVGNSNEMLELETLELKGLGVLVSFDALLVTIVKS